MSKVFNRTAGARPGRSVFNLSYEKKFTCDMGQLIPVMCDEIVPGDTFKLGNEFVLRFQPLIAPILHEVNVYVHYFFVPYRLLWDGWEEFITGGVDGESSLELPRWTPSGAGLLEGSLWDFLGFPPGVVPAGALPIIFPKTAYNLIYNEYYRDETLIDEVALTNGLILNRCWEKDYFTSALPWQQRGIAPALPISGMTTAEFPVNAATLGTGIAAAFSATAGNPYMLVNNPTAANNANDFLNNNTVDLSSATTFNVSDLRLAFQVQKFLERNARSGARYIEFLGDQFGVHPRDDRLQRPEYIGGTKSPVIISEVLQTSSSDDTATSTPQGTMAGHGISADRQFVGKYYAQEFGLIMGIMSIMPRSAYQQGIDRQWLRRTKYDFYFPLFANLSEQAVERAEIYATAVEAENTAIFGYQGRYNEMRHKRNMVCSQMRTTLNYWHMGRDLPSTTELNDDFVTCVPTKRVFAVQDEPGVIVNYGNIIKAIRPMPIQSNPGLIDHG